MEPVSRRTFLALTASVVLAACSGSDDSSSETTPPDPSEPGTPGDDTTVPTPDTTTSATSTTPAEPSATSPLASDPFLLGVASGDPTPTGVILWTRLLGEALPELVPVTYEIATDEAFDDVVVVQELRADAADGHSIHADATGLKPDSWYFYRFQAGGFTSPVGRTRTLPEADGSPSVLTFASASCQNYEDGFYPAHADIAAAGLDAVFWLGDYIYEGAAQPIGPEVVRTHGTPEPTTLADYRARYALYKQDPDLQASHASCPWIVTWDDHEVENNYAGLVSQDELPGEEFAIRRATAYQAWWEHQPVRLPRPGGAGDDYPIYRAFRFGDLADVSVLDTRQYRSDQACGDQTLSLDPACPDAADPDRTMLGEAQQAWLSDRLGQQGTTWNVLAQQVILMDARVGEAVLNYDQWDGYPAARDQLLDQVERSGAENLVVLTGDIHFAGVGRLRAPSGATVGVEFVDTSISSGGSVPAALQGIVASVGDVVDVELVHRGWTKHTVTSEEWVAEFRIVDDALAPTSTSSTWKTFRVEAGVADVVPV